MPKDELKLLKLLTPSGDPLNLKDNVLKDEIKALKMVNKAQQQEIEKLKAELNALEKTFQAAVKKTKQKNDTRKVLLDVGVSPKYLDGAANLLEKRVEEEVKKNIKCLQCHKPGCLCCTEPTHV